MADGYGGILPGGKKKEEFQVRCSPETRLTLPTEEP